MRNHFFSLPWVGLFQHAREMVSSKRRSVILLLVTVGVWMVMVWSSLEHAQEEDLTVQPQVSKELFLNVNVQEEINLVLICQRSEAT